MNPSVAIDMSRVWSIAEQTFVDPSTQYTFQFTSVHSDELAAGNPAPDHDNEIMFKMYDPTGTKCVTYVFDRAGGFVRSSLDVADETAPLRAPPDGSQPSDPNDPLEPAQPTDPMAMGLALPGGEEGVPAQPWPARQRENDPNVQQPTGDATGLASADLTGAQ